MARDARGPSPIWDNLPFSDEALPRVKLLLESVGLEASGEVDLEPRMLLGKTCRVTVEVTTYEGKKRNRVPFDGYAPVGGEAVDG